MGGVGRIETKGADTHDASSVVVVEFGRHRVSDVECGRQSARPGVGVACPSG